MADTMKAAVLYAKDDLRYEDYPMPEIQKPGDVKVRVRAAGICGSDVPRVLGDTAWFYPIVLGHEFCGEVVEVGSEVTSLQVGDHVSCAALVPSSIEPTVSPSRTVVSRAASADRLARERTSSATTAKPLSASPALAASREPSVRATRTARRGRLRSGPLCA